MKNAVAALALASGMMAGAAHATPVFTNGITIPGSTGDKYGTSVNDGRVGFFSDIYYDPNRNEWWALSDRGPGGGTLNYDTRMQRFTLDINPATGAISNFKIVETVKFKNGGAPFNGIAPSPKNVLGNSLDPEGLAVNPSNGHFYVSDEYGPSVYEFNRSGELVKSFVTPANLIPRNASNVPNYADDTGNVAGKRTNRGFEGLAISPDGKYVYAILQSAMLDEGGGDGSVNRIVKFDTATGEAVAQYAYQMQGSSQGRGVSSLVAINDHQFLVLERNNRGVGVGADLSPPNKRVYMIDIAGASDITGIDLDSGASYTAVAKTVPEWLNIGSNTLAELGGKIPEKWEGLSIGPKLADGSYFMLAGTDNDYSVTQNASGVQFDVYFNFADIDPYAMSIQCPLEMTTGCFWTADGTPAALTSAYSLLPGVLYGYKVSEDDLPGYAAPFAAPEPATFALFGLGLAGAFGLRRKMRR